jgi:alkylhydroperoxidase/carboxymuconolactone decarboxylase family protein YurZ
VISEKEVASQQDELRQHIINALETKVQRLAALFNLHENAFTEGALGTKFKHLIALAVAVAQRSEENILHQVAEALQSGASRDEIKEAVTVAVLTTAIPSLVAGVEALASATEFEGKHLVLSHHREEHGIATGSQSL